MPYTLGVTLTRASSLNLQTSDTSGLCSAPTSANVATISTIIALRVDLGLDMSAAESTVMTSRDPLMN
jgi:hypothetical protein